MKRLLWYAVASAVLIQPGRVGAQLTFHDGDQIVLANKNGAVASMWNKKSVVVGPYAGQLVSDPTTPTFTMYCVDFAHEAGHGEAWSVSQSSLTGGDLGKTRLGDAGLERYSRAAYLSSLFDSWDVLSSVSYDGNATHTFATYLGSYSLNKRFMWSGIHAAIWQLTSGGALPTNRLAGELAVPFLRYAAMKSGSAFDGLDLAEWSVLTNKDGAGSPQEMLVHSSLTDPTPVVPVTPVDPTPSVPTVTPEPETYVLLATGILVLFAVGRRKRVLEIGDV